MATATARLARLPDRRPLLSLVAAVLACEVVGASGSVFTTMGLESWYPSLVRPALAPPNWVFAPVWTTLFALMGVGAWLVWGELSGPDGPAARVALAAFVGQFVLNVAWSGAFFGLQSTFIGMIVITLLWVAIVATIAAFYRVDRRAAGLLVPYLVWVTFAGYLNVGFWLLN